jgi:hypothetical protein
MQQQLEKQHNSKGKTARRQTVFTVYLHTTGRVGDLRRRLWRIDVPGLPQGKTSVATPIK